MKYLLNNKRIAVLYIGIFITQFSNMVEPMLTILLQKKFELTAFSISLIFIIQSILLLISSIIGGIIADYCNRKYNIVICDTLSAILFLLCAFLPFKLYSVLLIIAAGAFQHMELASYSTIFDELIDEESKDKGYSLYYLFWMLGALFASALAGFFIVAHTRALFIANGVGVLTSSLLILVFFKYKSRNADKSYTVNKGFGFRVFHIKPILLWLLLFVTCYEIVHNQYVYMLPMETNREFPANGTAIYGIIVSFGGICAILFTTFITNMFHKKSHLYKLEMSNLSQGIGFLIIAIGCIFNQIVLFFVGFLVFTFGEIFTNISYTPYLLNHTPEDYKGRITGIFSVAFKVSAMAFNPLLGFLYDRNIYFAWGLIFITSTMAELIIRHIKILERIKE